MEIYKQEITKLNKVFVVSYSPYVYGIDDYYDIKDVMDSTEIKGVFTTEKKAWEWIDRTLDEEFGTDEELKYALENDDDRSGAEIDLKLKKEDRDYHYSVQGFNVID